MLTTAADMVSKDGEIWFAVFAQRRGVEISFPF